MKKLAIPVEAGKLSHHFGHSRGFHFFEIENNAIVKNYLKEPPPHVEGSIPRWLIAEKTTDLIVSGIGPKAINRLNAAGISVISSVEIDDIYEVASDFISGSLKIGESSCHHH